ncbi:hypothetical protein ABG768_027365 [Culter alburnus]|uniref:PARP4 MVP-ID C-terminal domain-containing protein n=1 Tax=Culter alburnus TaxID=194366 RepID=A0AAW2A7Y1_CULAL
MSTSNLLDFDCITRSVGSCYEEEYDDLEAAPAAPTVHETVSSSLSYGFPYIKTCLIPICSRADLYENLALEDNLALEEMMTENLDYMPVSNMQFSQCMASAPQLPPSPGIMTGAPVSASHHELLQDSSIYVSMESLSITHRPPPPPPPPGALMPSPCSKRERLSCKIRQPSLLADRSLATGFASKPDTPVFSLREKAFCGPPHLMSKPLCITPPPPPPSSPPPPPPPSLAAKISAPISMRYMEKSLAPPLHAASISFGQPKACKLAAVGYGSAPVIPQNTTEPLGYSGFSAFSFGASQQQQKPFAFSAPDTTGFPLKKRKKSLFLGKQISKPGTVAWNELFELQHEDGYWECTERLSSFLNLDVDFFANVFLKEKGIRSFGVKAHADILRLVATLLVLQLIRVKKLAVGQLLESLFRLKESQEPRPMHWEAVKRAVDWACRTDRQYPCVCSRLEIGWDWESSTRQLLGCDSPNPYSPLKAVLERRVGVSAGLWSNGIHVT